MKLIGSSRLGVFASPKEKNTDTERAFLYQDEILLNRDSSDEFTRWYIDMDRCSSDK